MNNWSQLNESRQESKMTSKLAIKGGTPVREKPFPHWPVFDEADEVALVDALQSGKWGRHLGDRVAEFESSFAEYQQARWGIGVANGSVALRIALLATGLQAGDEVIVPPYTFMATASAVVEVNAVPVFVDIEKDTYNLDPAKLEDAISSRTRAIIPVHFGGQSVNMDNLLEIAGKYALYVIEDAAHAHGAEWKEKRLGTLGHIGCFSFQATKNLNSGEGGAIVTNNERLERLCRAYHTCGRYPEGEWYEHFIIGGNYRMTEFQGALLLSQMAKLDLQTSTRDQNGQYLTERMMDIPGIRPLERPPEITRHAYHLFIFRYDAEAFDGLTRARFLEALAAEGIPCSPGYPEPLYKQRLFTDLAFGPFSGYRVSNPDLDYSETYCPESERACYWEACWLTQNLLLGNREDMDDIVTAISKIFEHRREILI
jgi:dTDP-4-amino-4,6-dideoxygalactose transaminase